jgi:hypothetical protein
LIALTTREFGEWATVEWPRLADAVLSEERRSLATERPVGALGRAT